MRQRFAAVSLFALVAACGHDHGIAGNWNLESPKDGRIGHIAFEEGGVRAQLGLEPDDQHVMFEYTVAGDAVTLKGSWDGKDVTFTGKLAGEHFELQGPTGPMTFHRGAHEHH